MRLGCAVVSIAGIAACAQGIPSEGLTDEGGASAAAGSGNAGPIGGGGAPGGAGAPAQGGAIGGAGKGGATGGGATGGGGKGGATGSAGKGGTGGSSGGGTAGSGTAGAGTGPQGCSHPLFGGTGITLSYMPKDAAASVPYVYFRIEIKNPDDPILLSDLHIRYYMMNDLTAPTTDFYSPQVKHANGNTDNLGANDLTATYNPTYVEFSVSSAAMLLMGETFQFDAHLHSTPEPTNHAQGSDYSFTPATAVMPWCNITVFQATALAWGTPPP